MVHYAGVACEMDTILSIAKKHKLFVVEDAAQAIESYYKGKPLGSIGHLATFSFHDSKNYTSGGEGGLLIVNHKSFNDRAEIIREKGTNRADFFKGHVNKYSWVDIGSSYLIGELGAAYLYAQLQSAEIINKDRLETWGKYSKQLFILQKEGFISLPSIPKNIEHNAHMFYIKTKNVVIRDQLIIFLKLNNINSAFHYIPLHSSTAGLKHGFFSGSDNYTTSESERLVRLPMYYGIKNDQVKYISNKILDFYA